MKGEKCDLQLSVTGANKVIFKKQKKVRFRLASLDNKYITDFICETSTAPNISNSFERVTINPKDYDYLRRVKEHYANKGQSSNSNLASSFRL